MDDAKSRLISGSFFGFFQTIVMAFAMLIPTMYFSSLKISIVTFSLLLLVGDVFSFLVKPFLGYLTDKYGEKRYLLAGVPIFIVSIFLIGQTASLPIIIALKIISGIASALIYVIIIIYSLRMVEDKPDKKVGLFGGIFQFGWVLGLLIPGLFIDRFGISNAFYLILAVGAIWTVLILKFARKYDNKATVRPSLRFVKRIPTLIIYKTMDLAMFSAFVFFFARYALQSLGLSRSVVSYIVVVEVLFFSLSNFLISRISNKKIRRFNIPLCIIFHAAAATLMLFATTVLHYYIVGIFIGIAGGFIDIWLFSKISETFSRQEKGKVIATFGWSYDLATILGAFLPALFAVMGLQTFAALYIFPLVILITYISAKIISGVSGKAEE